MKTNRIKGLLRIFGYPLALILLGATGMACLLQIELPLEPLRAALASGLWLLGWFASLGLFGWGIILLLLNA